MRPDESADPDTGRIEAHASLNEGQDLRPDESYGAWRVCVVGDALNEGQDLRPDES